MSYARPSTTSWRPGRAAAASALYVALFLGLDLFASAFEIAPSVSLWYPASGLSLLLAASAGVAGAPAIFLANLVSVALLHGGGLAAGGAAALAHTAAYTAAGIALRRRIPDGRLDTLRATITYLAIVVAAPLPVGLISCAALAAAGRLGWAEVPLGALSWWMGDWVGVLALHPLLMVCVAPALAGGGLARRARAVGRRQLAEALAEGAAIALALWLVLRAPLAGEPPLYLCLLPAIWIAVRGGMPAAAAAIAATSFGAAALLSHSGESVVSVVEIQLLMLALAITALALGALVSEQRRTAAALRESEARARAIVEDQLDLVCRYREDTTLTFVNEAYCRFFGVRAEDVLGRSFMGLARVEYHGAIHAQVAAVTATGEPMASEQLIYRGDGELRCLEWVTRAVRDAGGAVAELQAVGRDVTERRRAEQAYRLVVDQSVQGLALVQQGRLALVNRALADMLGLAEDAADAEGLVARVAEEHRGWLREGLAAAEGSPGRRSAEVRAAGQRWVEIHLSGTRYEGRPAALLIALDVTARREAEDERRAIERALAETQRLESIGLLAGGVAHDFNNLLLSIQGHAELALLDIPPGSPAAESVRQVQLAAGHAGDLTRQLLAYAGRARVEAQALDINQLVRETLGLLRVGVPPEVAVETCLADGLPPVAGDASQVRQVIMNMVINAAEAIGRRPGTVRVATTLRDADRAYLSDAFLAGTPEGSYVEILVSDTGSGMDEATRQRIFEPFFTTKPSGRGLGLAAVLGIVRAHRGALKLQSAPGQGTTFSVLLPLRRAA